MSDRKAQYTTETPFLPQPLAGDVLAAAVQLPATMDDAPAHHARLTALRQQLAAAVDTVELAIAANHADYLGGRRCWSYETSNEVKARLRILKRQRQHIQEAFGACNRWQRTQEHQQRQAPTSGTPRALAFVAAAEKLLDPTTVALLWELVDTQLARVSTEDA